MKDITNTHNLQILFEDNHLMVVNKRAGDIVQGDKTGDPPLSDLIKELIKTRDQKPGRVFLGVVHRLDRPTTGLVIFAKTSKALSRLNHMLKTHSIQKTYWALVKNEPPQASGTLVHWLKKNPKNNKSTAFDKETHGSKKAILHYNILQKLERYILLEIELETGRHHQIRAQLAKIGCPIKGDLKYGFDRSNDDGSIHLHARRLEFFHPVRNEAISITASAPKDPLWEACTEN